jgi:hypothetical protein
MGAVVGNKFSVFRPERTAKKRRSFVADYYDVEGTRLAVLRQGLRF